MKVSYRKMADWVAALALVLAAVACGPRDFSHAPPSGEVSLNLTGTATSGLTYRLRHATFAISGAATAQLSTERDPDAELLARDLPVGAYRVRLKSGWVLERRQQDATFEQVPAQLTSENPVHFQIHDQQLTEVRFRFEVGDEECELDGGKLTIGIDVDDSRKGCRLHADCASAVCDTYARGGKGSCIEPERVLYVHKLCDEWPGSGGSGTRADPFCQIREAVTAAQSLGKDVVRVLPGHYFPFAVSGRRLQLFGSAGEDGNTSVFEEDSGAAAVRDGADVVLDGFVLGGPTRHGLLCRGPSGSTRATVRRSSLGADAGWALEAVGCTLELDRVIVQSEPVFVELTDTRFAISNTFVGGRFYLPTAINIQGGEGVVRFSTLAVNRFPDSDGGALDCGSGSVLIRDSIVLGDATFADTGSLFRGACELDRVVVGNDPIRSPGAIHETPLLEAGYRLPYVPENVDCCIDRARGGAGVRWDIEGTPRPQGERADLGAYEVIVPTSPP
jgi:hypothetical protein